MAGGHEVGPQGAVAPGPQGGEGRKIADVAEGAGVVVRARRVGEPDQLCSGGAHSDYGVARGRGAHGVPGRNLVGEPVVAVGPIKDPAMDRTRRRTGQRLQGQAPGIGSVGPKGVHLLDQHHALPVAVFGIGIGRNTEGCEAAAGIRCTAQPGLDRGARARGHLVEMAVDKAFGVRLKGGLPEEGAQGVGHLHPVQEPAVALHQAVAVEHPANLEAVAGPQGIHEQGVGTPGPRGAAETVFVLQRGRVAAQGRDLVKIVGGAPADPHHAAVHPGLKRVPVHEHHEHRAVHRDPGRFQVGRAPGAVQAVPAGGHGTGIRRCGTCARAGAQGPDIRAPGPVVGAVGHRRPEPEPVRKVARNPVIGGDIAVVHPDLAFGAGARGRKLGMEVGVTVVAHRGHHDVAGPGQVAHRSAEGIGAVVGPVVAPEAEVNHGGQAHLIGPLKQVGDAVHDGIVVKGGFYRGQGCLWTKADEAARRQGAVGRLAVAAHEAQGEGAVAPGVVEPHIGGMIPEPGGIVFHAVAELRRRLLPRNR